MFLIMCIPVVNLVVLLLWAFGRNGNVNRRNFSRAALVYIAIGIVLSISAVLFFVGIFANAVQYQQYHRYDHYGNHYMKTGNTMMSMYIRRTAQTISCIPSPKATRLRKMWNCTVLPFQTYERKPFGTYYLYKKEAWM